MSVIGFIFARGGSKGLPNKNILPLVGKPLIGWSIEHALQASKIERVIVSTDSPEIAAIAKDFGAEVPFLRPANLAADDSPEILSWKHALEFFRESHGELPGVMVSIPPTAPLRMAEDLDLCIHAFQKSSPDVLMTMTESSRNPYFNQVKMVQDGLIEPAIESPTKFFRRQDCPVTYDLATVCYVAKPSFILGSDSIFNGKIQGYVVPKERALDIDDLYDFQLAEFFLTRLKLK